MKTLPLAVLLFFLSLPLIASAADPSCTEFNYIQRTMRNINATSIDHAVPHADWLDEHYRREDQIAAGTNTAKVVILALIGRLNFLTFLMMPTRMGDGTVTGSYARSPEAYVRFLQLTPGRACQVLNLGGSGGDLLREVTHEIYLELHRAAR